MTKERRDFRSHTESLHTKVMPLSIPFSPSSFLEKLALPNPVATGSYWQATIARKNLITLLIFMVIYFYFYLLFMAGGLSIPLTVSI